MSLNNSLRWIFLVLLVGGLAGLSATVFLYALDEATRLREEQMNLIWYLPLAGFVIGFVYWRWAGPAANGANLILDEIHDPKKTVPLRMAPLVLLGTLTTHLFGGSAGREGTAVQMGGSLADQVAHLFKVSAEERKYLLMAGMGAGFGAAIGTPIAGAIFGFEVLRVRGLHLSGAWSCLVAALSGYFTTQWLQAPHTQWPSIQVDAVHIVVVVDVALAGICFGLTARAFSGLTHAVERGLASRFSWPPLRPTIGGVILVALYWLEGSYRFAGLGIETIKSAFPAPANWTLPLFKALFTALTVGSGFKGGEFIPLVFIGTTLGSALSLVFPISVGQLSALGFAAVFGAAANTPIACAVMAAEIFGWSLLPYALIACLVAYIVSGPKGIYKAQR